MTLKGLKTTNHYWPSRPPLLLPSRLAGADLSSAAFSCLGASSAATAGLSSFFYYFWSFCYLGFLSPLLSLPSLGFLLSPLLFFFATSAALISRFALIFVENYSPYLLLIISLVSLSMVTWSKSKKYLINVDLRLFGNPI